MSRLGRSPLSAMLVAVAALGLGGCAGTMPLGGEPDDRLARMERRLLELQRESAMAQAELEHLRGRVAALEAALSERDLGAGEESAERGIVEPAGPPPAPPARPLEEADLEAPAPPTPESAPPAEPADRAAAAPAPPVTAAAQELYDRGYTLYHQNRYLDAEATFQRFLEAYGSTELGDNAQYWIGECRYARGDWSGALAAFREAVERYPEGNKVADALLKVGQSLEQLGDREGARVTYGEVLERFPESAAAVTARARRQAMR